MDGSNVFYLQKKLGWMLDWKKVEILFVKKYLGTKLNFYEAYKDDFATKSRFFGFLEERGFEVHTKKLKYIVDPETGKRISKGNFDVEITKDIIFALLAKKPKIQRVVLFSGDSDFAPLVYDLRKRFKANFVVAASRRNF